MFRTFLEFEINLMKGCLIVNWNTVRKIYYKKHNTNNMKNTQKLATHYTERRNQQNGNTKVTTRITNLSSKFATRSQTAKNHVRYNSRAMKMSVIPCSSYDDQPANKCRARSENTVCGEIQRMNVT